MAYSVGLEAQAAGLGITLPVLRKANRYGVTVNGTYRPDVPCTSSCKTAQGSVCVCSCAGANHGTEEG